MLFFISHGPPTCIDPAGDLCDLLIKVVTFLSKMKIDWTTLLSITLMLAQSKVPLLTAEVLCGTTWWWASAQHPLRLNLGGILEFHVFL